MNKIIYTFVFSFLLICYTSSIQAQQIYKEYQDGKIWFKLKDSHPILHPASLAGYQSQTDGLPFSTLPFIQELSKQYSFTRLLQPFYTAKSSDELKRTYELHFSDIQQVEAIIKDLVKSGMLEYAEKVPLDQLLWTPNDPQFPSNQWGLVQISAEQAWDISLGSPSITVATVDNAVQTTHPDLSASLWVNPGEIPGNGIDDDGNGYIDDINGYDVADNDNNPNPPNTNFSHGTHVAGITGATTNNGVGIASIGAGISIISVKATGNNDNSNSITAGYQGIQYSVAAGARVINCSWGGTGFSQTAQNIVTNAWNNGCIVVAAAGNDNVSTMFYPAAYTNALSVASTTTNDVKSSFSNYGTWIDVSAPGSTIRSTIPNNTYSNMSGTSMASPMVAGLLGLMLSHYPAMSNPAVISCLLNTCTNIDGANPNYIGQLGSGRINAYAAMQCVNSAKTAPPTIDFVADVQQHCKVPAQVKFTNLSFNANTYFWDFGNGNTSTQTNPTHFYTQSGTFHVKLVGTNMNGSDSVIKNTYIVINPPPSPTATGDTVCENQPATLTATGAGTLSWHNAPIGGVQYATGASYTTPALQTTQTYYVQDAIPGNTGNVGPLNNQIGGGGYHNNATPQYLIFDVLKPCTLLTAWVNASGTANRTFELLNSQGNVLQSVTVNVPAGQSTVTLNFPLSTGTGFRIGGNNMNLYRNNTGPTYPYTLPNVVTITGSTAGSSFYYYLYNWEIQEEDCISERTPVVANVITCVGLSENASKAGIAIYPNPASSELTLDFSLNKSSNALVRIYDVTGKTLLQVPSVGASAGANRMQLDVSSLANGLYMCVLETDEYKETIRFVVNK